MLDASPLVKAVINPPTLLIGNFLSSSTGVRSVCEDMAAQLSAARWPIITASDKPGKLARVSEMLNTAWRRRNEYEVAHVEVYSGAAFIWAELVCQSLQLIGKPFVLTLHGGNLPSFGKRWPGRVQRLLTAAAAVTTPSPFLLGQMKHYRDDMRLLPNPINLPAYEFKQRNQVSPSLVWLRAFHEIYNPGLAPRALARLSDEFPDLHLTMIGPDKGDGSQQKTERMASELGVAARIKLPGAIAKRDVPTWLNRGDIFLNTTNIDNTPVSVIEAMACGLSVVSTNVGGIPYLLEHERDALLVPPDDPAAMAAAVRRILTDPELTATMSRNARRKAERFGWEAILPQWENLLRDAVEVKRHG